MSDFPEDFSKYPQSITELRATNSLDGADWSPRDALISALREIDQGKITPTSLVICWSGPDPKDGHSCTGYFNATPDIVQATGTIIQALNKLQRANS